MTSLYRAFAHTLATLEADRGIYCGFSGNIDVIIPVRDDDFVAFLRRSGLNRIPASARADAPPTPYLTNIEEAAAYAAWFMVNGAGGEADLASSAVVRPLLDHLPHRRSVGGTGMYAANWLARAGFGRTRLHIPRYESAFADLLDPRIAVFAGRAEGDPGYSEEHCIIDYSRGARVDPDDDKVVAPRNDRVIMAADRYNSRLRIAPEFMDAVARPEPGRSALLVTGFNSPRTPADFNLFVDDCVELMRAYRRANPHGFVHVEECYYWDARRFRRETIAERILPLADSLGFNTAEFAMAAEYFHLDPGDAPNALLALARRLRLRRVCLHAADLVQAVTDYPESDEIRALGLGVLFSAARARHGDFVGIERLGELAESTRGLSRERRLLIRSDFASGYRYLAVPTLRGIPTVSAVGLGDAFTAGLMACL